jgi:hypothetical protein
VFWWQQKMHLLKKLYTRLYTCNISEHRLAQPEVRTYVMKKVACRKNHPSVRDQGSVLDKHDQEDATRVSSIK